MKLLSLPFLLFSIAMSISMTSRSQQTVAFTVNIPHPLDSDTALLEINSASLPQLLIKSQRQVILSKGQLVFNIPDLKNPVYISLIVRNNAVKEARKSYVLFNYLVEPGDNITVRMKEDSSYHQPTRSLYAEEGAEEYYGKYINQYLLHFTGKGSAKYSWQFIEKRNKYLDKNGLLNLLEEYKQHISSTSYDIFRANILGYYYWGELRGISSKVKSARAKTEPFDSVDIVKQLKRFDSVKFQEKTISYSYKYQEYLLDKYTFDAVLYMKKDPLYVFNKIQQSKTVELKDKLMLTYVVSKFITPISGLVPLALKRIKNPEYREIVLEYNNILKPGALAANFSLPDVNGNLVSLNEFKGKVVLMDFWYTGCPGCILYYQHVLKAVEDKFKDNKDVVFITISIDKNVEKWGKGIQTSSDAKNTEIYTSGHAINLWTNGMGADHPVIADYKVASYPRPILIDRDGKIFSSDDKELRYDGVERLEKTIIAALSK
jgi:thiol-disulfide isomerase/thioredoxin